MRALVATGSSAAPLELRSVEEPTADAGQAIVDVRAISINRGELRLLAMRPEGWRAGQDIAGVVAQSAADGSWSPVGTGAVAMVDKAGWAEVSLTAALRLVARDGIVVLFGNSSGHEAKVAFGSIMSAPHARLYAFFIYESGEPPTFGADLGLLAKEIAAGRLQPQVGLEASWRDPLGALEAVRQRRLEGKAVLRID